MVSCKIQERKKKSIVTANSVISTQYGTSGLQRVHPVLAPRPYKGNGLVAEGNVHGQAKARGNTRRLT